MKKLLILGLGDVAKRALPLLSEWQVIAPERLVFDLDTPDFSVLPQHVDALLYTVPPANHGETDTRLASLLRFWQHNGGWPKRIVYISTSGVYGDCLGAWVDESGAIAPMSARALRRADAEAQWFAFAREHQVSVTILRAPGIYAAERLPLQRIRDGVPVLLEADDCFSNHIHADDLAMMCACALARPSGWAVYNACDDLPLKMGDWLVALAAHFGLPAPERCSREALVNRLTPLRWSFVRESRQMSNAKIKAELGVVLRYPTVLDFLRNHGTSPTPIKSNQL